MAARHRPATPPEPYHGPRFPVMTIRDNVEAVHRLLTEELKVTHVRAIIGFSMGAQQAFPMGGQLSRLRESDRRHLGYGEDLSAWSRAAWKGRSPRSPPTRPSRAEIIASRPGRAWRLSEWCGLAGCIRRNGGGESCGASRALAGTTFEQVMNGFRTRFSADANDYILQARTWEKHDVGATPGFGGDVERRCARSKCRCCTCPRKRISTFRSAMPAMRRHSSRRVRPDADPIAVGPHGRCRQQSSGREVPE